MTYKNKEARYQKKCEKQNLYREVAKLYDNAESWEEFSVKLAASGLDKYSLEWRYKFKYLYEDMPDWLFYVIAFLLTAVPSISILYAILWLCDTTLGGYIVFSVLGIVANALISYFLPLRIIDSVDP